MTLKKIWRKLVGGVQYRLDQLNKRGQKLKDGVVCASFFVRNGTDLQQKWWGHLPVAAILNWRRFQDFVCRGGRVLLAYCNRYAAVHGRKEFLLAEVWIKRVVEVRVTA